MVTEHLDIKQLGTAPASIAQEHIQLLQKQSDRMPWCSSYRVLLARGYSNEESYLQNKYLRLAATYSGDKEVLFQFMTTREEIGVEVKNDEVVLIEEEKQEVVTSVNEEAAKEAVSDDSVDTEKEPPKDNTSVEPVQELAEVIEAKVEIPEAEKLEASLDSEEDVIESKESIDTKTLGVQKESALDFDEIVTYDPLKELQPLEKPIEEKENIPFDYVAYNPEQELNKLIEEKQEEEEHNFLFWLNNIDDDGQEMETNSKSPDHVQNLLDQFLATKRSRPIQNREFYKAESKAEESETDNMDVISETLLELYIKQGHFKKAIKGYKKLSLQNPEKSAYFAARIKEIKHKEY